VYYYDAEREKDMKEYVKETVNTIVANPERVILTGMRGM